MKRFIALMLACLIMLSLCACGSQGSGNNTDGTAVATEQSIQIAQELQGKWYGPNNTPELNINADGTGKITFMGEGYDATFTAENNVFTAASQGYNITGGYTLEGDKLTVTAAFDGKDYKVIFTRTPLEIPEDSYIYSYGEETYEINLAEGKIIVCAFPPEKHPRIRKVYFEYVEEYIYIVHPYPPYDGETETTPTNSEDSTSPTAPSPEDPEIPLPKQIDITDGEPKITMDDETVILYETSDDITGTWTTVQDGTVSIFGYTSSATVPITYTFNADGTGTILAMGIIPGTMTYSVENGVLNLTVSMLGDTESGTGYVQRVGDTLHITNVKGDVEILKKQG